MEIEVENAQPNEQVDWTKNPQLVICIDKIVVLTDCNQEKSKLSDEFSGVRIDDLSKVEHSTIWDKKQFKPFHGKITLSND
jgi:hypothetical protein